MWAARAPGGMGVKLGRKVRDRGGKRGTERHRERVGDKQPREGP